MTYVRQQLPNAEIAQRMGVTYDAVRRHLKSIHRKFDTSDRTALCALANALETVADEMPT